MNEIPIIPGRGLVTKLSTQMRLDFLGSIELKTDRIASSKLDLHNIQNNIESYIGTTEIPLGVVGPLLFDDEGKEELVYCAAGTLEGALVASMNRGAKALSMSGGFSAKIAWQKMSRSPMFLFENENDASTFKFFAENIFSETKKIAEKYSNHAKLLDLQVIHSDTVVHLKFIYSTGDASGQNMTTTCTWHAMLFIAQKFTNETGIIPVDFVIEGNGASDKKVSLYNIKEGRGINVTARCSLSEKVINEILRTTSEKLLRCYSPSQKLATADGMVGYNINVANAIAAIFVATGQDLASIHESAVGILFLEKTDNGLMLRLTLPNLVIGTVGGGTHLPKQSQALETMKCLGNGKVERFAKLIAGFALGLEISTYAAIVSGEFAKSHEKLGRNKPVNWLLRSELTHDFILSSLNGFFKDKDIQNIYLADEGLLENGIITTITGRISKKIIGFVPLNVEYKDKSGELITLKLLMKSKALDEEVIKGLHLIAASIDPQLSDLLNEYKDNLEFKNCHLKELELCTYLHEQHFEFTPLYFGKHADSKREIFFFIQEFLSFSSLKIFNSENHPEKWQRENILRTIDCINTFHQNADVSKFASVQEFLPWQSAPLYKKFLSILIKERAEECNLKHFQNLSEQIDQWQEEAESIHLPKTIIHNDFNPRNIALQLDGKPVIYDWELAMIDFPHRDIVEFLSFVLPENFQKEDLYFYLDHHYRLNDSFSRKEWISAYKYSLKVYISCRVSFYEVSGILIRYDFSRRVLQTAFRMLECLNDYE
ncbi:MAG: phosphotransferase [Bacteroidota bacterium]